MYVSWRFDELIRQHKTSSYKGQKTYISPFSISPQQSASPVSSCGLIKVLQYILINHSVSSLLVSLWAHVIYVYHKDKNYSSLICLIKNLNEIGNVSFVLLAEKKR